MVAGKRASTTTRPQWWMTTNEKSVHAMMRATMKMARVAGAMVTLIRVPSNNEEEGGKAHGVGNEGGI